MPYPKQEILQGSTAEGGSVCGEFPNSRLSAYSGPPGLAAASKYPTSRLGDVTIGELSESDNVLLKIFRYYVDASPRLWPRLVHICRKWRRIVFASQQTLHLRLFCTPGTPVIKALHFWPAFPIVVEYGGSPSLDPPGTEDEDNIMAALKHSGRVNSISLTVTSSLQEKLCAINRPFSELEDLVLLSQDGMQLTLPSTFRWGPRLRSLHLTRISFPALPQLLYSSKDLVDIQLHDIARVVYLSPESLADGLSGMSHLRSLSLHLPSYSLPSSLPDHIAIFLSSSGGEQVAFPALTHLKCRGTNRFLERFMVRIYSPLLADIEISSNELYFAFATFYKFMDRIGRQKLHRRAEIIISEHTISISLPQPGAPMRFALKSHESSSWQWSDSIAKVFRHLTTSLSSVYVLVYVEDLRIHATRVPGWQDEKVIVSWMGLIRQCRGTKSFHIGGNLSADVMLSIRQSSESEETLLPSLQQLHIRDPGPRYALLRESVVSIMVSRRLSGHIMAVEYEGPQINEQGETGPFSHQKTIEMLSDDVLLNIFRGYLDATSKLWHTLTHICRRWRQIVLRSPLGLDLRLYCTYGTPVLKTLKCWPSFPLVVNYGGSPMLNSPTPEDDENIMAALNQPDRVGSISLTVTGSLLQKLSTVSEPFSELEGLVLLSQDNLTLPSTFRWGLRLRTLHITRIAIPGLPALLSPSTGLVDLQLHDIPIIGYFSPEEFANTLSGMTQLVTLSLHFLAFPPRRNYVSLPPEQRIVLPALTYLKYRGASKYLDSFVAIIDAPRLVNVDITCFSQPTMDASQLGRFIERTEMQRSLSQAEIQIAAHAISISFTDPSCAATSTPPSLQIQISCKQLDWQLSSMAQILDQCSQVLWYVENVGINRDEPLSGQDDRDVNDGRWPELIRGFSGAKDLRVAGVGLTDVLGALGLADGEDAADISALFALRNLCFVKPMAMHGPSWDAVPSFITRWPSGAQIAVSAREHYSCHICNASFTEQRELKTHLVDNHAYRFECSYCGDLESLQYNRLFREHLQSKHPEVVRNHDLIPDLSPLSFPPFRLDDVISRHGSLRAPVNVVPSSTATARLPQ